MFDAEDGGGQFLDNLEVRIQHNGDWRNLVYQYDSVYVLENIPVVAGDVYEIEFEYNEKVNNSLGSIQIWIIIWWW